MALPPPLYTYTLSSSTPSSPTLYVPLTSYCNAATLPQTRGPNFVLPPHVVAALCRVRDAERDQAKWEFWCRWLDQQEAPQKLPERPDDDEASLVAATAAMREKDNTSKPPSVEVLLDEIERHLAATCDKRSKNDVVPTIVVAGEGEPTLRLIALLELMKGLEILLPQYAASSRLRITTNGLLETTESVDRLLAACQTMRMRDGGREAAATAAPTIQIAFSVALMTHDRDLYDQLMAPAAVVAGGNTRRRHHERVQDFVRAAVAAALDVEVTAVERPEVDQIQTQELAAALGVTRPVRWRRYFP